MEKENNYRDQLIKELEVTKDQLIAINEKQIEVNMRFAQVTEKNNAEFQKSFRWLICASIGAIVIVCIVAMTIITKNLIDNPDKNRNINENRNTIENTSG